MKNIFVLIFLFVASFAQAQSAFLGNSVTANGITFTCRNRVYATLVFNSQNIYVVNGTTNLPTLPEGCRFGYVDELFIKQVFKSVFSANRCAELTNEDFMISFYIERDSGILKELYYDFSKNTKLTPQEIAQLEVGFKAKIYTQRKKCTGDVGIVIANNPIIFSEIYK